MNKLSSLQQLPELIELDALNELLDRLFADVFEYIEISDFFETEEAGIHSYSLVLGVEQSIQFQVPGLEALSLGVIRDSDDEWPLILFELVVEGAPVGMTIRHFPLRVTIDNPFLLPLPPEDIEDVLSGFAFEIEGTIGVDASLELRAAVDSFSLPAFTIRDTGLILGLDECRIITTEDQIDDDITNLGFDSGFRGLHAQSAQFYWDIPFQIAGNDLPGLRANLQNLAIGNDGVSVEASLQWQVTENGQQFDASHTELLGSLFDSGWQCALEQLEVVIQANVPIGTTAIAYLRVPFLKSIIKAEIGFRYEAENHYRFHVQFNQTAPLPVTMDLGNTAYELALHNFQFQGDFSSTGEFSVHGQSELTLNLPGLQVQAENIEIQFEHQSEQDNLLIQLDDIDIDGFGQIEQAQLVLAFIKDEQEEPELALFELLVDMQWQDISDRIQLDQQSSVFPLPPDDAQVSLRIHWHEDSIKFSVQAELDDVEQLWRFIPTDLRPEVDDATIDIELSSNNGDFDGEVSLGFLLQLPNLATIAPLQAAGLAQMIQLDTGDDNDRVHVQFIAEINNSDSSSRISASLQNPLQLTMQLPGMILPEPPVHFSISSIGLDLNSVDNDVSGVFELSGVFQLHPVLPANSGSFVPPVIARQLDQLLAIAKQVELSGEATLILGISAENTYMKLDCAFAQAGFELDLFDMLSNALRGGEHTFSNSDTASDIDLDIDVSIALQAISVSLGSEEPGNDSGIPFAFSISSTLGFIGQSVDMAFELTQDSLNFGLDNLTIPIAIPQIPLTKADLDKLKDNNGVWDYQQQWLSVIEPDLANQINSLDQELEAARTLLQQLQDSGASEHDIFQQQFRVIPQMQARLFQFAGRKFLYEAILAVHQMLGTLGVDGSQATYQQGVEIYQSAVDSVFEHLHVDTGMQFKISDARFVLPFNDPADIRVEGGASIIGIPPDDPLAPMQDLVFKLGISADAIYFSVEGGMAPVPLPDFGRYPGNAVSLDRFIIGYGYNKNSLKIDFAGELILSEALLDDADTSSELGFGIRLPSNNKLQFNLDLIPIVLGEVDFVIPLVAFDMDLRSDTPLPTPMNDGQCRPAWDGLQVIAPDVLRADIKRVKYSPFFGPLPAINMLYAFDFELGNQDYGISHICDDYFVINPVLATIPIPFLADSMPFFNHYCTNIRLGGFTLSFDLSRPFPSPSPLLIFELLGFISDPSLPIDPNGHIANLMYAQLHNARITLPPPVLAMFPALAGVVNKDFSGKLNVASVFALAQQTQALADDFIKRLQDHSLQGVDWLQNLIDKPPQLSLGQILQLLPADLRQLELQGRFVYFDASATFILALARDVTTEYGAETTPLPLPQIDLLYDNDFSHSDLSDWQAYDYGLKSGKGNWQVNNNRLLQNNNVGDNSPARYGAMLIYKATEFSDIRLHASISATDNDGIGLVFHFQDKDTFYRFRMTQEQNQWSLTRLVRGHVTTLFESRSSFSQNTVYQIRIETFSSQSKHHPQASGLRAESIRSRKVFKQGDTSTTIKIWINDSLWCVVEDRQNALSKGYIGFDSWWNNGARFHNLKVYQRTPPAIAIGKRLSPNDLNLLSGTLSSEKSGLPDVFADFDAHDIAEAMHNAGDFSVAVVARVKVFAQAIYKMLGAINADGRFLLMSRAELDVLNLSVAGIDLPLEIQVAGRLVLQGRSAGADSYARIEAGVYGDWIVITGNQPDDATARLLLASESDPALLQLSSDTNFTLKGHGELQLFAQQIIVQGQMDISQAHIMMAGELEFKPDIMLMQNTRLMELTMDCQGRVGPGSIIDLSGEGELRLMGKTFSSLSARVHNRQVELSAGLSGSNQEWSLGNLNLSSVQMQLTGQVDFRQATPAVAFNGEGEFTLFGARISGQCSIEADHQQWLLAMAGQLFWQGRNWLDGKITLSDDGVTVQGRVDFGINLTPQQLPANINIAGLHLNASISGQFNLNSQGQLLQWDFDLDWQLSIKLPGTEDSQAFPIATQQLTNLVGTHSATDEVFELQDLIAIDGLTLFNFENISIPVPILDFDNGQNIYLRNSVTIDIDGSAGINIPILTTTKPNPNSTPVFDIGLVQVYQTNPEINLPDFNVPIPILSTEQAHNEPPLLTIPDFSSSEQSLGQLRLEQLRFSLKLAWQDGKFGVLVVEGNTFVPFDGLVFGRFWETVIIGRRII